MVALQQGQSITVRHFVFIMGEGVTFSSTQKERLYRDIVIILFNAHHVLYYLSIRPVLRGSLK